MTNPFDTDPSNTNVSLGSGRAERFVDLLGGVLTFSLHYVFDTGPGASTWTEEGCMSAIPERPGKQGTAERAASFVTSAVHAKGAGLEDIEALGRAHRSARALDFSCGGGHATYRLAPYVKSVDACDTWAEIVTAVVKTSQTKGFANVVAHQVSLEALPFEDRSFDLVVSRFGGNHWRELDAPLREAHRAAKPGAPMIFIDAISPGRPSLDSHLQAIKLIGEPIHVRFYTVVEWIEAVERAGFTVRGMRRGRMLIAFAPWIKRMQTDSLHAQALLALQTEASSQVRAHYDIQSDGSFWLDMAILEGCA